MRPTVGGEERLLEIHLFDFSEDIYGESLRVQFDRFLRAEKKFGSVEELRDQIGKDVTEARKFST
jgi:riboflavin kinase/FMN adenylyltransferase